MVGKLIHKAVSAAGKFASKKSQSVFRKGSGTAPKDLCIIGMVHSRDFWLENLHVIKEGWLWKCRRIGKSKTTKWIRRYCLLVAPGFIVYFEDEVKANAFKALTIKVDKSVRRDAGVGWGVIFEKKASPLVRSTFRYLPLHRDPDRESKIAVARQFDRVKISEFEEPPSTWKEEDGTIKERTNLITVTGYTMPHGAECAITLSCESEQERAEWMKAVGEECIDFIQQQLKLNGKEKKKNMGKAAKAMKRNAIIKKLKSRGEYSAAMNSMTNEELAALL